MKEDAVSERDAAIYGKIEESMLTTGYFAPALKEAGVFPPYFVRNLLIFPTFRSSCHAESPPTSPFTDLYVITKRKHNAVKNESANITTEVPVFLSTLFSGKGNSKKPEGNSSSGKTLFCFSFISSQPCRDESCLSQPLHTGRAACGSRSMPSVPGFCPIFPDRNLHSAV